MAIPPMGRLPSHIESGLRIREALGPWETGEDLPLGPSCCGIHGPDPLIQCHRPPDLGSSPFQLVCPEKVRRNNIKVSARKSETSAKPNIKVCNFSKGLDSKQTCFFAKCHSYPYGRIAKPNLRAAFAVKSPWDLDDGQGEDALRDTQSQEETASGRNSVLTKRCHQVLSMSYLPECEGMVSTSCLLCGSGHLLQDLPKFHRRTS